MSLLLGANCSSIYKTNLPTDVCLREAVRRSLFLLSGGNPAFSLQQPRFPTPHCQISAIKPLNTPAWASRCGQLWASKAKNPYYCTVMTTKEGLYHCEPMLVAQSPELSQSIQVSDSVIWIKWDDTLCHISHDLQLTAAQVRKSVSIMNSRFLLHKVGLPVQKSSGFRPPFPGLLLDFCFYTVEVLHCLPTATKGWHSKPSCLAPRDTLAFGVKDWISLLDWLLALIFCEKETSEPTFNYWQTAVYSDMIKVLWEDCWPLEVGSVPNRLDKYPSLTIRRWNNSQK